MFRHAYYAITSFCDAPARAVVLKPLELGQVESLQKDEYAAFL